LVLLRHGATENNVAVPARLQGRRSDLPLSAEGRRQAEEAGRFLANAHIDAFFSSPLLRARQTAAAIAAAHSLPVTIHEGLLEVDVGEWEGMCWPDIEKLHPEAYRSFMADPGGCAYLGGESFGQVQARVLPVIQRLMQEHLGQTVVAVTHNVVNRVVVAHLMGIPLTRARGIFQENCGINLLRYRHGDLKLITLNAVTHLSQW
jgi:broad specificity phosphatase PhoE